MMLSQWRGEARAAPESDYSPIHASRKIAEATELLERSVRTARGNAGQNAFERANALFVGASQAPDVTSACVA